MKREGVGLFAGILATWTLGDVQIVFGILCAAVMVVLKLPEAVKAWRNLVYDYRKERARACDYGPLAFVRYCVGALGRPRDVTPRAE